VDDPLWRHTAQAWTGDLLVLGAPTLLIVWVVGLSLRCDPPRRRAARPLGLSSGAVPVGAQSDRSQAVPVCCGPQDGDAVLRERKVDGEQDLPAA
jgi:hypothetical protein